MEVLAALIYIALGVGAAVVLSCTIVMSRDFVYYRKIYYELPKMKFYRFDDTIYSYRVSEDMPYYQVIAFGDGSFRLWGCHYLHDTSFTYWCPYSFYWLMKYKLWFEENIDAEKLESW